MEKRKVIASKGQLIVHLFPNESLAQISAKSTPTRHTYFAVFEDGAQKSSRTIREEHFGCNTDFYDTNIVFTENDVYSWESKSKNRSGSKD